MDDLNHSLLLIQPFAARCLINVLLFRRDSVHHCWSYWNRIASFTWSCSEKRKGRFETQYSKYKIRTGCVVRIGADVRHSTKLKRRFHERNASQLINFELRKSDHARYSPTDKQTYDEIFNSQVQLLYALLLLLLLLLLLVLLSYKLVAQERHKIDTKL